MDKTGRELRVRQWIGRRVPALLALGIPCLAGLAYLSAFGAPASYFIINGAALVLGLAWAGFGGVPDDLRARRIICGALLAILALPLITGPQVNEVSRWIPLGAFQLHAGMVAIPLLVCLAARDREYAPPILLSAVFLCLLQPDAGSIFALMVASVGLYFAWWEWKTGVVAALSFGAALLAAVRGILAPQPFVEQVLASLVIEAPFAALGLLVSLIASFLLMLRAIDQDKAPRYALAGALAGFALTGLMANYPNLLIGYGASPIIGFALALGMARSRPVAPT